MSKTSTPEVVAWVRKHPDGALTAEFLEDAVITSERKESGTWLSLVTLAQAEAVVQKSHQWVSVVDYLPEPETDVLVKCTSHHGPFGFDIAGLFEGEWMSQVTETSCRHTITHWMPLPTPPTSSK